MGQVTRKRHAQIHVGSEGDIVDILLPAAALHLSCKALDLVQVTLAESPWIGEQLGVLLESPSWWTVSYELAPTDRKNEYLAAFDLSWALIAIAGPAAMAGIVASGAFGWLFYGVVLAVAAAAGTWLARRRATRMDTSRAPVTLPGALPE